MRSIFRRAAAAIAVLTLPALIVACTDSPQPRKPAVARATTLVTPATAAFKVGDDNHDGRTDMRDRSVRIARPCLRKTYKGEKLARIPAALLGDCFRLSARKPRTVHNPDGSSYSDPAGAVLVIECRSDSLTADELTYCIRQP